MALTASKNQLEEARVKAQVHDIELFPKHPMKMEPAELAGRDTNNSNHNFFSVTLKI